ncbi:MAG: hypothetical protein COW65_18695 [Cytophagales bacterium CG18_big_fil_WC_8_21_14_2_50_42_9]|nr:MAG: hypothetical protein COW65_18695 [Cytophagales bacterium CG18_big_fil_WC_8_21_14_2_50_42_9]
MKCIITFIKVLERKEKQERKEVILVFGKRAFWQKYLLRFRCRRHSEAEPEKGSLAQLSQRRGLAALSELRP